MEFFHTPQIVAEVIFQYFDQLHITQNYKQSILHKGLNHLLSLTRMAHMSDQ